MRISHRRFLSLSLLTLTALLQNAVAFASPQPQQDVGKWELLPSSDHPLARHECAYVRVGNQFYLIGGRGSHPIKPVEIFDPATRTWSVGAAPPVEIHHFQAVGYQGKVYVVGAMTGDFPKEPPLPNVYIYDPVTDQWSKGPSIPADRQRGGAGAVVYKDKIYLVNGIRTGHWDGHVAWFDVFDPKTGEWKSLPDSPRPRDHFQTAIIDDKLYVAGGRRTSMVTNQPIQLTVPEVDVYDLRTNQWSTLPAASNLPTLRAGCTAVVVKGRLLILGGESGTQHLAHSEVEAFDPHTRKWTELARMNVGRHASQAILYKDHIYIAAGSATQYATEINSQEVFTLPRWLLPAADQ
jgi:N-acetylneuraminic acid mutarotase